MTERLGDSNKNKNRLRKIIFWTISFFIIFAVVTSIIANLGENRKSNVVTYNQNASPVPRKPIAEGIVGGKDLDLLPDNRVNLWDSPRRGNIVAKIPNRSKVYVLEITEINGYKYYKIRFHGSEGWVGQYTIKITRIYK